MKIPLVKRFAKDVKENKIELIVDNDRNQEMIIIENIVEDPIEVKYKDESITHNLQIPIDLLKMTTQYVDFLGVENFNFWKICDEAKECWEDIQIDRKWQGKHPICSWQRMKNVLIDLWFPNDYYDILDYTSVDYKSIYSNEKQYV